MSYEGHEQVLCKNGHYHEFDCYEASSGFIENWVCADLIDGKPCGAKAGVCNDVDETNCDSYGHRKVIELAPVKTKTCDMGSPHVISHATYKLSDTRYYRETKLKPDGSHETVWHSYAEDSSVND